jgi:lipoyl(octanoyl) transferase
MLTAEKFNNASHATDDALPVAQPPEWCVSAATIPYAEAMAVMEQRVAAIDAGQAGDLFWLLEHPPLYTAGTSASPDELIDPTRFPVHATGRGGRYTYHGPGQRIAYVVTDLRRRDRDLRAHVARLEELVIRTLRDFGVIGERRAGRIGIWVDDHGQEKKIAAIGVRIRRWVAYHGLALNVHPDLNHFSGIVPCGIAGYGVTSLHALGIAATMDEVDQALRRNAAGLVIQE